MHICTVAPNYLPHFGGAEVGVHMILKQLAATTEHQFSVVTPTIDASLPHHEIIDGVAVYRYQRPRLWAKWFAPTLAAFAPTARLLRQLKPDVIHISFLLPSGIAAWNWAKSHDCPVLLTLGGHDIYDPFNTPPWVLRQWSYRCLRRTRTVAVYSNWVKDYLADKAHANPDSLRVVGFGIDVDKFNSRVDGSIIRDRYGIAADTPLILALQRLEVRKGVDMILKAAALLQDAPYHVLIGGKGRDADVLNDLVKSLGLKERVTFCGFVPEDEKHLYYASADIFALHSYHEGLGIVLAEAAACGKPIVSTVAGGTTDVVLHEETGLLVTPGDVPALADALRTLLNDAPRRKAMGARGEAHIVSRYSLENIAQTYLDLFEDTFRQG